eukprot:6214798-Pleurochrysis_carterae.AAC.7
MQYDQNTTDGESAHRCRALCASHASSLAWEWRPCMAAAEAGVLQLFIPDVLTSVGCSRLAMSSARGAFAASFVSRVPPSRGKGARPLHTHEEFAQARIDGHGHPRRRKRRLGWNAL